MDPLEKTKLVESLCKVLESAGVLSVVPSEVSSFLQNVCVCVLTIMQWTKSLWRMAGLDVGYPLHKIRFSPYQLHLGWPYLCVHVQCTGKAQCMCAYHPLCCNLCFETNIFLYSRIDGTWELDPLIFLPTQEEDVDFEVVLSKLVNGMGCALVTSWNKWVSGWAIEYFLGVPTIRHGCMLKSWMARTMNELKGVVWLYMKPNLCDITTIAVSHCMHEKDDIWVVNVIFDYIHLFIGRLMKSADEVNAKLTLAAIEAKLPYLHRYTSMITCILLYTS